MLVELCAHSYCIKIDSFSMFLLSLVQLVDAGHFSLILLGYDKVLNKNIFDT